MRDKPLDAVGTTGGVGKIDTRMKSEPIPRTEASIQPIDDWVRKCEGLQKQIASAKERGWYVYVFQYGGQKCRRLRF